MPSTPASFSAAFVGVELVRLDPAPHHLHVVAEAAVGERLVQALVGVLEGDVLADDPDRDLALRVLDPARRGPPRRPCRGPALVQAELLEDDPVEALGREHERHLVDRLDVLGRDHGLLGHVAEEGELGLEVGREEAVGAAEQDARRDADRAQLAHAVLHRLRLQLVGGRDVGDEGEVDEDRVLAPHVLAELAHRLEEGQALDVADRAADLDDHDVGLVLARGPGGHLPGSRP